MRKRMKKSLFAAICDLRSAIYDLFLFGFSELGAGCSKDGLGQDVPATMKRLKKRLLLLTSDFCLLSSVLRLLTSGQY
jgi:hypothetical protein